MNVMLQALEAKVEELAHKLELDVDSVLAHLHKELDLLLGRAEDNIDAVKEDVKASATADVNALAADADKEIAKT